MKLSVPIRIAFTLVVVAAALWAATNKRLYDIAVFNVLVSMGLAAIIVLHLRVQLSFLMGQAYATWHRFGAAGMFIYIGLPVLLAMVAAGHLLHGSKAAIPAMAAFLVTAPVGVIFYNLFPALGPTYIFGPRFPWNPLTIDQAARLLLEPILVAGYRNAMPSLHIAWVLLAWWFSRGLSVWERSIAMVFVVFTVFATLGSGEHYVFDVWA